MEMTQKPGCRSYHLIFLSYRLGIARSMLPFSIRSRAMRHRFAFTVLLCVPSYPRLLPIPYVCYQDPCRSINVTVGMHRRAGHSLGKSWTRRKMSADLLLIQVRPWLDYTLENSQG